MVAASAAVGLSVAVVLELLAAGVERQQALKQPIVDREGDHRSPDGILTRDIAVLQQVVEDRPRLGARLEGQGNDRHRLPLGPPPAGCFGFLLGAEPTLAGALVDLRAVVERAARHVVDPLA